MGGAAPSANASCRNLDIADTLDEKVKSMIPEIVGDPANMGSRHLKFLLQDPTGYGVQKGLVEKCTDPCLPPGHVEQDLRTALHSVLHAAEGTT